MAYRYNRINWQNKPNVATPISAENLNKMDKGIDDNDKAIGDLAQLNTLNKSSLVSAVNELNNNLTTVIRNIKDLIVINNSNFTIEEAKVVKSGKNVELFLILIKNSAIIMNENFIITMPSEYRPASNITSSCILHDIIDYPSWGCKNIGFVYFASDGGLLVRDYNNSSCRCAIISLSFLTV